MADTDDTNISASKAASGRSSSKSALRRKMVGRGQTSLSSRSPMVLPGEGQPLLNLSKSEPAIASIPELVEAPGDMAHAEEPLLTEAASIEVPEADVPAINLPAIDLPVNVVATDEPTAPRPVAAKRRVGRPRKVPAAASSFSEGVAAAEPAAIMRTENVVPDDALPVDTADADLVAASVAPIEIAAEPAEPSIEPVITKSTTTPNPLPSSVFSIKDMTMDMSANFNGFQGAMSEAQAKAQAAFEKSSSLLNEAGDFAKGNVEAIVESSKIFAEGVQTIGSSMVAEGRTAFEAMTGDIKELAAVKSPTDFFKLQSELVRKNFDNAVAQSSKNTETLLKLMSDAFAPVSGRVSLAVEKARQVSPLNTVSAPTTVNA